MKRRITAILLLVLLVGALFALAACNAEVDKDDECKHNMVPDTETLVEPTCEKDGSVAMRCTKCDEMQKEVIPALAHAEKHEIGREESTCEEQGYVMYECNYCDETFKEDLPLGSHTETDYPDVEPGCVDPGYTGGKYCSVCDVVIVARTEIPALAHADKHEIGREASTCEEQGYVMYECNYCDETFKEDLPLGSHTETDYPDVEPGCVDPGYTGGKYCSVCDEELAARTEIPASGAHNPTPYTEDQAPTCGEVGYTGGTYCTECGKTVDARTEIPATGEHSYDYIVITEPAFEVDGVGKYECSVCHHSYTESIPALTYSPDDVWDGSIATDFASGTGTQADPYIIETAAQLAYLVHFNTSSNNYCKDLYFKLGRDIVLNDISNYSSWHDGTAGLNKWTPIGVSTKFCGNFDGAGFAVRGMYCVGNLKAYGLFGTVESYGSTISIKNLKVTEAYVSSAASTTSNQSAAGIVYACHSRDFATVNLTGLHFDGKIITKGSAAAILNWASLGGHRNLSVSNRDDDYGFINITNCTVSGKIMSATSSAYKDVYLAGVIATVIYDNGKITISNCLNNATVSSRGNGAGVIGDISATSTGAGEFDITITNCGNNGEITANGNAAGFACVIFLSDGYRGQYSNDLLISGCYNNGKVTRNPSTLQGDAAGFACTINHWTKIHSVEISGCYNTGDVIALPVPEGNTVKDMSCADNVAGFISHLTLELTSYDYPVTLKNCFNTGNVDGGTAHYVGGLFTYLWCKNVTIDSCYNAGNVTTNAQDNLSYVGGIAAYASKIMFTNVYNVGDISGNVNVGGIAGYAYGQDFKLQYAYNAGKVTGLLETSNQIGAIIGKLDGYESFLAVYYLEGCATDGKGKAQGAMGSNRVGSYNSDSYKMTANNAYNQSAYNRFDFSKVWNAPSSKDKTYPTLKNTPKLP